MAALGLALVVPASAMAGARGPQRPPKPPKFSTATNSSPITLSADGKLLWVVNPDSDSVSVIRTSTNQVLKTLPVGNEPQQVAVDPSNLYAYVANAAAGTVTVIRITNPKPGQFKARIAKDLGTQGTFATGAEPLNIVASPDGRRIFVANAAQDTITVIDATERVKRRRGGGGGGNNRGAGGGGSGGAKLVSPKVIGGIVLRGSACSPDPEFHFQPRGLAVTKNSKQLYVTSFFSFTRPGFTQVNDEGRQGIVCRIDIDTESARIGKYKPIGRIAILPRNTGFTVDQSGDGVADPTFAWPNQMQSIVIRGKQAYLPNIAASPEGPLRFNVDTEAFLSVITGVGGPAQTDAGSINMHLGARTPEAGKKKLFFANPWAIDFTNQSGAGAAYVVSSGSDLLVRLNVGADGGLSFTGGDQTTRYIDLNDPANPATSGNNAGKNPRGIVINPAGTRAYVMNFVSRNVSVVDLTTDTVLGAIRTAALPPPGSTEEVVQVGAEMFFSSRGHFNRPAGTTVSTDERLSSEGWQSCSSCHFDGLTDSVVWAFGVGPRKSIPLNASFNPFDRNQQKILNYSAIFDEVEDFELNIRNVSGPGGVTADTCQTPPPATSAFDPNHGLIIGDNGNVNDRPCVVNPFPKPNAGRPQLTVTLPGSGVAVPALTALKEWVRLAIRTPEAPIPGLPGGPNPADLQAGATLFANQGCANCHGGALWTTSAVKNFTSPPAVGDRFTEVPATLPGTSPVANEYLNAFLRNINSFNIGVQGQGNDLGNNIGGPEFASQTLSVVNGNLTSSAPPGQDALGRDYNGDGRGIGFSPQSLLGIFASPPYYHNGACETLSCVLSDVQHRTGLGASPDLLTNSADRAKVERFLEAIDVD